MKKINVVIMILFLCLAASPVLCFSQEAPAGTEDAAGEIMKEFTFGTVVSVSEADMVIREYNFDMDSEEEVSYKISPDVELDQVNSVSEIKAGDDIEIEYRVEGTLRIAEYIYVDKILEETAETEAAE